MTDLKIAKKKKELCLHNQNAKNTKKDHEDMSRGY